MSPRSGWCLALLLAVLCANFTNRIPAAELLTWGANAQPLGRALADLGRLSADTPTLAFDLATSPVGAQPITVCLRTADPTAVHQALAFSAGVWWADDPAGAVTLTLNPRPPRGPLRARTHSSGLRDSPATETLVRSLTAPWLGAGPGTAHAEVATLTYVPENGLWLATLDIGGQARLVEILALLQLPTPSVPPLVPDTGTPLGERILSNPVGVLSWNDWVAALATATDLSVSLAPGLPASRSAPALAARTVTEIPAALASAGLRSACIHGVWCISGANPPEDREHPVQRRRFGIIPLPHLASDEQAGQRLATGLRTHVVPDAWTRPGWSLTWLPTITGIAPARGILVAADPMTIHAVLDACDVLDRLGVEAGIEALAR